MSTEKLPIEFVEGNRLIAEFMGVEFNEKGDKCNHPLISAPWPPVECLRYHTSWDWLKPVVDRIYTYALAHREQVLPLKNMSIVVEITPCWRACVDFIKWYNSQNL